MLRKNIIIFLVVVLFLMLSAEYFSAEAKFWHREKFAKENASFTKMLKLVSENYVDEVDKETLMQGVFIGMLASLDKYSQYLTAEMYREIKIQTIGQFAGVGIAIYWHKDFLEVLSCIENSPAEHAGILAGDKILAVDEIAVSAMSPEEAVLSLRGKKGSSVSVTVLSKDEINTKKVSITRNIVVLKSVTEAKLIENELGYISLVSFSEKTKDEFQADLKDLMAQGMEALIIDVRNNPGGVLDDSVEILNFLLTKGQNLVEIKSRIKKQNYVFRSAKAGVLFNGPIVVLINKNSASGAEIVAGVLKDTKRAIVIGEASFGKGSVQSVIPVGDGAALKITTGRYYLPNGETIEGKGVLPDIIIEETRTKENKEDAILKKAVAVLQDMLLSQKMESKRLA